MKISEAREKYMANLILIITSKTVYAGLFKAFLSLVSLYVITSYTSFEMIHKLETESYRLRYVVEHELKKEIELNDFECVFEMKSYPECKLAKYSFYSLRQTSDLMKVISHFLLYLCFLPLSLAILGFFSNPFYRKAIPYISPPKT